MDRPVKGSVAERKPGFPCGTTNNTNRTNQRIQKRDQKIQKREIQKMIENPIQIKPKSIFNSIIPFPSFCFFPRPRLAQ